MYLFIIISPLDQIESYRLVLMEGGEETASMYCSMIPKEARLVVSSWKNNQKGQAQNVSRRMAVVHIVGRMDLNLNHALSFELDSISISIRVVNWTRIRLHPRTPVPRFQQYGGRAFNLTFPSMHSESGTAGIASLAAMEEHILYNTVYQRIHTMICKRLITANSAVIRRAKRWFFYRSGSKISHFLVAVDPSVITPSRVHFGWRFGFRYSYVSLR